LFAFVGVSLPISAFAEKDRFEVGEEVPIFTLKVVNPDDSGESFVSVDNYYGPSAKEPKKAVLVSFFATYCEPCKKEMPYLAALHENYKDKGLEVLLVSIDKEADKIEFAKNLAKEHNVKFPVLSDRFNIVAKRYFISKLPCVYLINSEGKVDMVNVGYSGDVSKTMFGEVRKALGEPASDPVPPSIASYFDAHGGDAASDAASAEGEGDKTEERGDEEKPAVKGDHKKKKKKKQRK
jgi:alkyl hydroperoxide reductase subunit AhpC